ncbi:MAG: glycine cleavage system aminomethyltransferase GcvT [Actinomycetes bacterium]
MTAILRTSPLDAVHRSLGARMAEFGGWEMPIQYSGVIEEHRACRETAVVFDVSHLGSVRVSGPGAFPALQWAFTNDLNRIEPGRAQYTHLLDERDAHVVDDIIVWWLEAETFTVMPNASNTAPLVAAIEAAVITVGGGEAEVADVTDSRVVLAVQGPEARKRLATFWPEAASVGHFHVIPVTWLGESGWASGTGYTGEDGVELEVPASVALELWQAIVASGVTPAGLGARDTLRLEAGLPLHGHELGEGITSLQAGLAWVVRFDKPGGFRGAGALRVEQEEGPSRVLRGISVEGRQPPRGGSTVFFAGDDVGEVSSGNFSPMLGHGIALAFLKPSVELGAEVTIEARGRELRGTVVRPPFVKRS